MEAAEDIFEHIPKLDIQIELFAFFANVNLLSLFYFNIY